MEEEGCCDPHGKTLGDYDERRRARRPTVLLGFSGGQRWKLQLPEKGRILLGRGEGCDVAIKDARVSRTHCCLHVGGNVLLEDLGSTSGTRLMGRQLHRGEKVLLKRGDVFEIGDTDVMCQADAPAASVAPASSTPEGEDPDTPPDLPGTMAMRRLREMLDRIAASRISVLISGETGVGKGVLAAELHRRSARAGAFVALNCAELQETLLESELFGHERGAFTGASASKAGLIETAEGGTLFLDEIGEMSLATQAKLLRVLEERSVRRVGSLQARTVDVRVLAASNRDLATESERGLFRRDLFFRLNGISLLLPPLRERMDEIESLARTFLAQSSEAHGRQSPPELEAEALELLKQHSWPGNIRELRNVLERAVVLCPGDVVTAEHIAVSTPEWKPKVVSLADHGRSHSKEPDEKALDERRRIEEALDTCAGNQSRAAKLLGISRATLVSRLNLYGFPRPRKRVG
ncbi:MAG TPA: sigma 54-interacting transcriptional regulator [Myxococcaceae bacterium]|nr:sigma 54-interacting transcriptional regulator [Myxococcaceae bacterium]